MTDVLFADVSSWQPAVDDSYPHPVLSIRSNDGTYRDPKFAANYAWAARALDSGKLKALIIYHVYRPNWLETFDTVKGMVGNLHPRAAVMIDVESWGGQIAGDHSSNINNLRAKLADWIGNPARVIAYGNKGDLDSLWPHKPVDIRLVVASYGRNISYPGMVAHQFADNYDTPPFGPCDINSADGCTVDQFCEALGIGVATTTQAATWTPAPAVIEAMQYGQTGDTVRRLQTWLNSTYPAYSRLPTTGYYGDMTVGVIREFQHRVGIMDGDGRNVGGKTIAALRAAGYQG